MLQPHPPPHVSASCQPHIDATTSPRNGGQLSMHINHRVLTHRDATFTVSPNRQYRGFVVPTTEATTGPEWNPARMEMKPRVSSSLSTATPTQTHIVVSQEPSLLRLAVSRSSSLAHTQRSKQGPLQRRESHPESTWQRLQHPWQIWRCVEHGRADCSAGCPHTCMRPRSSPP